MTTNKHPGALGMRLWSLPKTFGLVDREAARWKVTTTTPTRTWALETVASKTEFAKRDPRVLD